MFQKESAVPTKTACLTIVVWCCVGKCCGDHSPRATGGRGEVFVKHPSRLQCEEPGWVSTHRFCQWASYQNTPSLSTGWCLSWDPSFNKGWDRLHNWNLAKKSFQVLYFILYTKMPIISQKKNEETFSEWDLQFPQDGGFFLRHWMLLHGLKWDRPWASVVIKLFRRFCVMEKDETDHKRM